MQCYAHQCVIKKPKSKPQPKIIGIKNPDDNLIFALLIKCLSDRQINIDKKLIEYIIKRIDRSYEKIFLFIHKVDKLSLKKGKPVDLVTIKEALKK